MTDLDPKLTFDSFVVGPANRLASAAAHRAADSPGTSYNPLFVYSASGLGKSHILTAIAHHSIRNTPDRKIEYMALEGYLEGLAEALGSGDKDGFKGRFVDLDILLLDDVQFLAGQPEAQEMLLRTLDQLSTAGGQIVLASDRPPAEINGLDARLVSRFSGGLIVDIGPPEFETRVAIIRRKCDERGQTLEVGVAEALARYPFRNVRELTGALNKVFARQDLEDRKVTADEVSLLMGDESAVTVAGAEGDLGAFLEELVQAVGGAVEEKEEPWQKTFQEAIDAAEREGYSAQRLKAYQAGSEPPEDWEGVIETFKADVQRLRAIDRELDGLGNPWYDAAQDVVKDPERLDEAETLLTSVRERQRPFPKLDRGPTLERLKDYPKMALKAADQILGAERPEYSPLYVWSDRSERGRTLLGAVGRTFQKGHADARMAVTSVREFAQDFIRALSEGVAGAWRERWWTVDLLLVHGLEALSETERAQDEFFHLFEALKRRGARVMLAADRPPTRIAKIDERLRSRFEGGLVLELETGTGQGDLHMVEAPRPEAKAGLWDTHIVDSAPPVLPSLDEVEVGTPSSPSEPGPPEKVAAAEGAPEAAAAADGAPEKVAEADGPPEKVAAAEGAHAAPRDKSAGRGRKVASAPSHTEAPRKGGKWFPSGENVVLVWPRIEDLLLEELE